MTDDPIKAAELRGYSRGYSAGKRRAEREEAAETARRRRERFRQEAFLAILPQLIAKGTWGIEVKGVHTPWTSTEQYSDGAWNFADRATKRANFS